MLDGTVQIVGFVVELVRQYLFGTTTMPLPRWLLVHDVGDLASMEGPVAAIRRFCDGWNQRCRPFTWTKDADQSPARLSVKYLATGH